MPSADEFETNFSGHGIPAELAKLRIFDEEEADGDYFSQGFELTVDDKSGLKSWSTDPTFLAALMPFAQANGSGSFYALWANGAKSSEMPVVIFGDEGGAFVVAENVRGLMQLLTYDVEPIVEDRSVSFFKDDEDEDEDEDENGSPAHEAFVEWLKKTMKLKEIDDPDLILEEAQKKHGDAFKTWLAKFYEG